MIDIPDNQSLLDAEEARHQEAKDKIERDRRIALASFWKIPEEEYFKTDKHGYLVDSDGVFRKYAKPFVRTEDGKFVEWDRKHLDPNEPDWAQAFYYTHGKPSKKNKSFKVGYRLLEAPNGMWVCDQYLFNTPPQGGRSGGWHVTHAFISAEEAFTYQIERTIKELVGPVDIDTDPQEIEVPCPDCEAWKKKHIIPTKDGEEDTTLVDYDTQHPEECPQCQNERPCYAWSDNEITRLETPEEVEKRVKEQTENPYRGWDSKYQPDAEAFANQLLGLIKGAKQLSLF